MVCLVLNICLVLSALELVTLRSVNEMVEVLKKEVGKTHNTVEHEDTGK